VPQFSQHTKLYDHPAVTFKGYLEIK